MKIFTIFLIFIIFTVNFYAEANIVKMNNTQSMKVIILGCGSSHGIPRVNCKCSVCCSIDQKNIRTRSSILIKNNQDQILIDASPDLRMQALKNQISYLSVVLFTHMHFDQTAGIPELIYFSSGEDYSLKAKLPIFLNKETVNTLQCCYSYLFKKKDFKYDPLDITYLEANILKPYKSFKICGIEFIPILQDHTRLDSLGFIFNGFAYCTDFKKFYSQSLEILKKTKIHTLILNCISIKKHHMHTNFEEAMEIVKEILPKRVVLTNMGHEIEYNALCEKIAEYKKVHFKNIDIEIIPGYDNLVLYSIC